MRKSNFALRLQPSLLDEARNLAEAEGVALNQPINVAVAEKLSAPAHGKISRRTRCPRRCLEGTRHSQTRGRRQSTDEGR
jgi:hypothetical protein